jgi:DNA mismatch repair ATPase MutS
MKGLYYLPHIGQAVSNDVTLKKNLIISGPNASGKTTILKSILINSLLSQQFGYGCYKSARVKCYDLFHSYLNIPDTSGRDSLFQAEARRCKEILDCISENPEKIHLCIFDELYSGTNPTDAVMCAKIYINKMNEHKKKVDYLITTHYIELCNFFDKNDFVYNMKMKVTEIEDNIEYKYKLVEGISTINGGKYILKQLESEK